MPFKPGAISIQMFTSYVLPDIFEVRGILICKRFDEELLDGDLGEIRLALFLHNTPLFRPRFLPATESGSTVKLRANLIFVLLYYLIQRVGGYAKILLGFAFYLFYGDSSFVI